MNNDKIKELTFENYIWVIYIVVAIVNIYGDELIKKSIIEKDFQANKEAMKIFKSILIINIIIYFYFLWRNYRDFKKYENDKKYLVRFIGSVFVLVGTFCFFYFQENISVESESISNV